MTTLNLYKERKFNTVILTDRKTGEPREFKLPTEYTVEEVERLQELQIKRLELEKEEVKGQGSEQLQDFWAVAFDQVEVLFQHYQPEITAHDMRSYLTHQEALDIIGFYNTYRFQKPDNEGGSSKKKILE